MSTPEGPAPGAGRRLAVAAAGLALAAVALWGGGALDRPEDAPSWTGGVALLALAGIAGIVATAGVLRRIVGGLLAVAGCGVAVAAAAQFGAAPLGALVLLAGGLLLVAAGVLVAVREPGLARFGARYSRTAGTAADPDRAAWDALDAGLDPTTAPDPPGPCRNCGNAVVEPVFAAATGDDSVLVGICPACGTGEARHRSATAVVAATVPADDAARLRGALADCPDPLREDCPCAVHEGLRTFPGGTRIDAARAGERLPEIGVALGAGGAPHFT
ncbi:Tryptophan-associated transmembrane protein (Trp_oprn_chp) [Pseudonocardia thermophila]|uniref:Tryptophan-associated transmembrane protein (Trp_oprn_chp) n=1 Tax=Pseudonocardia thermophila TaxID=1848 RepID=A0A1M6VSS3_PSETH|nr:Trp biosynthesis-associated membrane protein [Pseudonocardia thermophila]SHK84562.1 Tryptophan-associated transmembrane protein (Trp_oprn_chp) [Pseudonocardia thermophila]